MVHFHGYRSAFFTCVCLTVMAACFLYSQSLSNEALFFQPDIVRRENASSKTLQNNGTFTKYNHSAKDVYGSSNADSKTLAVKETRRRHDDTINILPITSDSSSVSITTSDVMNTASLSTSSESQTASATSSSDVTISTAYFSSFQRRPNSVSRAQQNVITLNQATNDTKIHRSRLSQLRTACKEPHIFGPNKPQYLLSKQYNFSFCKVPKVGSTFWIQMFQVLEKGIVEGQNAFNAKRSSIHRKHYSFLSSFNLIKETGTRAILISRDPFSRLFSAYIDKIFLPLYFSKTYKIRDLPYTKHGVPDNCPVNVTFQEFLDWVVKSAKRGAALDRHWAPITSLCRPCDVKPFLLVKQETFTSDVEFALEQLHVERNLVEFIKSTLHDHRIDVTIPGIVSTVYGFSNNINVQHCLGWTEVARRIWRAFQIQGYIAENLLFPNERFTSKDQYKNPDYLSKVITDEISKQPLTSSQSKAQRYKFLCAAWSGISPSTISNIQDIYKHDFLVYGYANQAPK